MGILKIGDTVKLDEYVRLDRHHLDNVFFKNKICTYCFVNHNKKKLCKWCSFLLTLKFEIVAGDPVYEKRREASVQDNN